MSAPSLPVTKAPVGDKAQAYYSTDGSVFTAFADVKKVKKNTVKVPKVPTSNLLSAAETSQPGRPDYGELGISAGFDKTLTTTILGWISNQTILQFKAQLNDGSNSTNGSSDIMTGYVTEFNLWGEIEENKQVLSDLTVAVTGGTTYAAGT